MDVNIQEVIDLVKDTQKKGKFNLDEFLSGAGYPEDEVTIYIDSEHAYELTKINEALLTVLDPDEAAPLEARAKELADLIVQSRVVFRMRGLSQAKVEEIQEQVSKYVEETQEPELENAMVIYSLLAESIVSVENAEGDVDETPFTSQRIKAIEGRIPAESWEKLVSTMHKMTLASGYFKGLTDAGFLPKS
jgi:hypothetical protein